MTELEMLAREHAKKCIELRPHSKEEITEKMASFRIGFLEARKLAVEELKFIGPYFQSKDAQLGAFLEARYLSIYALGDHLVEQYYDRRDDGYEDWDEQND